jgi:hypothetical protein
MSLTVFLVLLCVLVAAHLGRHGLRDMATEALVHRVRFEVTSAEDVQVGDVVSGLGTVTAISHTGYQEAFVRLEAGTDQSVLALGSAVLVRATDADHAAVRRAS